MQGSKRQGGLAALAPLYLVIFIGFCGYSLMVTLFVPMLMADSGFLAADASAERKSVVIGLLLAVYPLGQFVGSPVIGALSDRYGRKPVLLISMMVTIAAYLVVCVGIEARSLALLATGCLVGGLAESNIAIAQSAIADETTPDERPRLFAWTYSASSLGYIVGPVVGGQIAVAWGWSAPFWLVLPLLAVCLGWVWLSFVETHAPEEQKRFNLKATATNLAEVFTDRPIRRLYLINFLVYLGLFGFFRMVLVFMVDRWNTTVDQTTLIYSGLAVISALASFFAMAPLAKAFGLQRLAVGSAVVSGLAMMSIVFPPELNSIWFTAAPAAFFGTLALAACPTILANAVSADRQGRVMGNNMALQVGAESAGSAAGGALAGILIPLPLIAFGILLIAAGFLLAATRAPTADPMVPDGASA